MGRHMKHPELREFKDWLKGEGYADKTILGYISCTNQYLSSSLPLNVKSVKHWDTKEKHIGVYRYLEFLGVKTRGRRCDYDCFNCKYRDCIKI